MEYNYTGSRFNINKKYLAISALVILLVFGVFFFGKTVTSFLVYSGSISKELNETRTNLTICNAQLTERDAQLSGANSLITTCQNETAVLKTNVEACTSNMNSINASFESCKVNNTYLESQKKIVESDYEKLAENAASDLCCPRGIKTASWSINDSFILCGSGNRTVNCTA